MDWGRDSLTSSLKVAKKIRKAFIAVLISPKLWAQNLSTYTYTHNTLIEHLMEIQNQTTENKATVMKKKKYRHW